jgi:predicted Zn-dependent protease
MKRLTCALLLLGAISTPATAFEINLNKLGDMFKKAGQLKEVDEKGEIEIGEGLAANLLGGAPLMKNEALQRYVNRVGRWLALHTERPDLPWHFGVLDHPNVNAFAAPGGYIFVTRGLLEKMHSEAELAGVLAHEIAHVLKKHHLNAIQKAAGVGLVADALSFAAQAKGQSNSKQLEKVLSVGTELYARGLDKDDEMEADRMGVIIAARAGYDAFGLVSVLQTLDSLNAQDSSLALMFKTHPAPSARLEALDATMGAQLDGLDQPTLSQRFHRHVKNGK